MKSRTSFLLPVLLFLAPLTVSAITVELVATVPGCGDGIVETGEQCDVTDFGGASCSSLGFSGGALSCTLSCTINTSACTAAILGGGGSTGGGGAVIPFTNVVFVGRSSPRSTVTLLKDAQVAAIAVAGIDGIFQVSISGVSGGNYIFSVYSEDATGLLSSLLTFPIRVTFGATTKVSGIFIAPTIAIDKTEVKRGDSVMIFGQSAPSSEITISINSYKEFFVKKMTDANGTYVLSLDTSLLEAGQYQVKSKAMLGRESSPFGKTAEFLLGTKTIRTPSRVACGKADLNCDKRVNLTDFSIAAYWYKRPFSAIFKPIEIERLNGDGKIDLVDFSIMAFYWTG
jgi:hypothetical protein